MNSQNLNDLLENALLVDAKPYYLFHTKEYEYLRKCGVPDSGLKDFMRLVLQFKELHMDVLYTGDEEKWMKREITVEDLNNYFLVNDAVIQRLRIDQLNQILTMLYEYLLTHRKNNVPHTDIGHGMYMLGLARWYVNNVDPGSYKDISRINDGDVLNFFSILGSPSPVIITSKALLTDKHIEDCRKFTRQHKLEEESAALKIFPHLFKNASWSSKRKIQPMTVAEMNFGAIPKINDDGLQNLRSAVFNRYQFLKLCLQKFEGPQKKIPILLRDMHHLASILVMVHQQLLPPLLDEKQPQPQPYQDQDDQTQLYQEVQPYQDQDDQTQDDDDYILTPIQVPSLAESNERRPNTVRRNPVKRNLGLEMDDEDRILHEAMQLAKQQQQEHPHSHSHSQHSRPKKRTIRGMREEKIRMREEQIQELLEEKRQLEEELEKEEEEDRMYIINLVELQQKLGRKFKIDDLKISLETNSS